MGVTDGGITDGGGGGGAGRTPPRAPPNSAGAPAGGGGGAGAPVCGVDCCGACAAKLFIGAEINMAAASDPEMSVAVFFIRETLSKRLSPIAARCEHLAHDLDLDRLVGEDV